MEVILMLLSLLNRKEKLKFLDLALHMVSVDGKPNTYEERLLNMMLAEVGDGIVKEYTFTLSQDYDKTLKFFSLTSAPVRNIVFLNLLRVTMIDEFYNTLEHHMLEKIQVSFEIGELKKKQLMRIVYDERDLKERARRIVSQ
jgi:hypothetical protein